VPAPAIASIRTIDKKGVEIPDVDELEWYPVLPADGGSAPSVSVKRDPSTGRFEIRAPAGRIFVEASDSTFRGGKRFELSAGRQLFDLRLTRLYSFVVALRHGSARLPWEGDVPTAKCVDGGGYPSGWSTYDGKLEIVVTRPGRYTFSVPTVAGYLPVPDQEVTVLPDATVEHVIELVRER
jgi:hypothetical protein